MASEMDVEVKQEPVMRMKTEDGEMIVVKRERNDDEYQEDDDDDDDEQSTKAAIEVRPAQASPPKSLLRRTLIDLDDNKMSMLFAKKVKEEPKESGEKRSISTGEGPAVKRSKIIDEGATLSQNAKESGEKISISTGEGPVVKRSKISDVGTTLSQKAVSSNQGSNAIESPETVNCDSSSQSDEEPASGTKSSSPSNSNTDKKSNNVKIVFDVSGKLKEWRIEGKKGETAIPASNLKKILMFADMMKKKEEESKVQEEVDLPNLAKMKKELADKERERREQTLLRRREKQQMEDGGGEVEHTFKTFKCKTCDREFMNKQALTNHMKIHHLSLSGMSGSTLNYSEPRALPEKRQFVKIPTRSIRSSTTQPQKSPSSTVVPKNANTTKPIDPDAPRPVAMIATKAFNQLGVILPSEMQKPGKKPGEKQKIGPALAAKLVEMQTQKYLSANTGSIKVEPVIDKDSKVTENKPNFDILLDERKKRNAVLPKIKLVSEKLNKSREKDLLYNPSALTDAAKRATSAGSSTSTTGTGPSNKPAPRGKTKPASVLPAQELLDDATVQTHKDIPISDIPAHAVPVFHKDADINSDDVPTNLEAKKWYKCELCHLEYLCQKTFEQHVALHAKERPLVCGICDESFYRYADLEEHLTTHADPSPATTVQFTCSQCDEEFDTEDDLQDHLVTHGNDVETETVYECGACNEELNSQQELKIHMKKHMADPFEPCKCGFCKESFSEVSELKSHIRIKHYRTADFICRYCRCRFQTSKALKEHIPIHLRLENHPMKAVLKYKCRFCQNRYASKEEASRHCDIAHRNIAQFECSFCHAIYLSREKLQAHIKTHSVVAHFL